ncbi:MAG: formate dehydrogenase accessory sulfurtransferase FdhD [Ktedonobacterales bacterium]|nr:formate dehydrogenase accessory sulfurtransferase FdhD [Ktedonobacterales bacterium]
MRQVSARIVRWSGGAHVEDDDELAAEDPLEIRAVSRDGGMPTRETVAVIMRTPGHDEELTAGFLYGEGFVRARSELATLSLGLDGDGLPSPNILDVESADGASLRQRMREAGYTRRFAVNASCGVCGKNTVAAACASLPRLPLDLDDFTLSPEVLYALPECLRVEQRVFHSTGGLHAAGLFDAGGTLLALREDVGRHNAVDKLVGRALLDGALPLHRHILLVSGRLSFEIVQKALAAGIRLIAAVSAPSSLAVDLAEAGGITLAAFLRDERVNVYTHPHRVAGPQTPRS